MRTSSRRLFWGEVLPGSSHPLRTEFSGVLVRCRFTSLDGDGFELSVPRNVKRPVMRVSSTRWQPRPASPGLDQHRTARRFEAPHLAARRGGKWSWGEPGTGEGEFNIVHNICCDADGWLYVADRENHRVQVFDGNGKYETQWKNLHRPCGLYMPYGHQPIC